MPIPWGHKKKILPHQEPGSFGLIAYCRRKTIYYKEKCERVRYLVLAPDWPCKQGYGTYGYLHNIVQHISCALWSMQLPYNIIHTECLRKLTLPNVTNYNMNINRRTVHTSSTTCKSSTRNSGVNPRSRPITVVNPGSSSQTWIYTRFTSGPLQGLQHHVHVQAARALALIVLKGCSWDPGRLSADPMFKQNNIGWVTHR